MKPTKSGPPVIPTITNSDENPVMVAKEARPKVRNSRCIGAPE